MLTFLFLNEFMVVASASELEAFALAVANDWLSRSQSAQFLNGRAMRLSWSEARLQAWVRRHSPSDRVALTVLSQTEQFDPQRFPEAVRRQLDAVAADA